MVRINRKNPVLIFTVVFGLLIFLHSFKVLRPVENVIFAAMKPVGERFYRWGSGLSSSFGDKREKEDLQAEISRLKQDLAGAVGEKAHCEEIKVENDKLRGQLDFRSQNNYRTVLANIIAQEDVLSAAEGARGLIIDKGGRDGLKPEQGVINEQGAIIGLVTEVSDNSARVCLVTSPGCRLAAALQNEDKTKGITDGNLGLTIGMSYIPQLEKIAPQDTVVTSGLGGSIPRGLVIGQVADVKNESNEVWQSATIEPAADFNDLTVVSVVIP